MKADNRLESATRNLQNTIRFALRKLLRPVVRLLLAHDVNYPMILEDIKRVFVSIADEEFKIANKPQTISRITLITGVHRRDVQRIREEKDHHGDTPNSFGAQIIGLWTADKRYLDSAGHPLPLATSAKKGGNLSFESLVASISKDIRSKTILDEWLRQGLVSIDDYNLVVLNTNAFIPDENIKEKVSFLGKNIHDHTAATVSNILKLNEPMLERCVYYQGLSDENVKRVHELARKMGMESIQAINRYASELKSAQTNTENNMHQINFGVYFYQSKQTSENAEEE
jgi:uncharacterized protein YoaH (UPF0181 family)